MIHADHRHPSLRDRVAQVAEPAAVRDVEHADQVGLPQRLDGLGGPVHAGQILEQESEPRRRRRGVGDGYLDAFCAEEVRERDFAAQSVSIGIDVRGEGDVAGGGERAPGGCRGSALLVSQLNRHTGV